MLKVRRSGRCQDGRKCNGLETIKILEHLVRFPTSVLLVLQYLVDAVLSTLVE